jgi:predicted HAD superfamily Cof-like phosphohydrolase
MSYAKDVREFHQKFGIGYRGKPRALKPSLQKFRNKCHLEELREYRDAVAALELAVKGKVQSFDDEVAFQLENALDAIVDTVYFLIGTADLHGFDFDAAWKRVHAANMAKVRVTKAADSKRKNTNDVKKPPGWRAPRHRDLVINHAHSG